MKNKFEIRGDVIIIFLKRKDGSELETKIDAVDLEKVNKFPMTWHASWEPNTNSFYCGGNDKAIKRVQKKVKLHRYLFDNPEGYVIDHINHDTLDNRRSNLRVTEHNINSQNRRLVSTNKSGTRGVSWSNHHKKWCVSFTLNGKTYYFGRYEDLEHAKKLAIEKREEILIKLGLPI